MEDEPVEPIENAKEVTVWTEVVGEELLIAPEVEMVTVPSHPKKKKRDSAASELGSGGTSDVMNTTGVLARVAPVMTSADYSGATGDLSEETV